LSSGRQSNQSNPSVFDYTAILFCYNDFMCTKLMFKYAFSAHADCHKQYKIAKGKIGNGILTMSACYMQNSVLSLPG